MKIYLQMFREIRRRGIPSFDDSSALSTLSNNVVTDTGFQAITRFDHNWQHFFFDLFFHHDKERLNRVAPLEVVNILLPCLFSFRDGDSKFTATSLILIKDHAGSSSFKLDPFLWAVTLRSLARDSLHGKFPVPAFSNRFIKVRWQPNPFFDLRQIPLSGVPFVGVDHRFMSVWWWCQLLIDFRWNASASNSVGLGRGQNRKKTAGKINSSVYPSKYPKNFGYGSRMNHPDTDIGYFSKGLPGYRYWIPIWLPVTVSGYISIRIVPTLLESRRIRNCDSIF